MKFTAAIKISPALLLFLVFSACNSLEYSPNQYFSGDTPIDVNAKNIKRLQEQPGDERIRFVMTGDSQRAYDESKILVTAVNKLPDIDFVVLGGDISDFGLSQEMEWVGQIFSKLNAPYIGVIGNHDLVSTGAKAFKRMFGPLDYSFIYKNVKFICHNTNSRESSFSGSVPDMDWLKQQLLPEAGVDAYIPIAHVPPGSPDFDENLYQPYVKAINGSPNTLASFYAHSHEDYVFYPGVQQRIPYVVTDAIEHRQFILVEILDGKVRFENISY